MLFIQRAQILVQIAVSCHQPFSKQNWSFLNTWKSNLLFQTIYSQTLLMVKHFKVFGQLLVLSLFELCILIRDLHLANLQYMQLHIH